MSVKFYQRFATFSGMMLQSSLFFLSLLTQSVTQFSNIKLPLHFWKDLFLVMAYCEIIVFVVSLLRLGVRVLLMSNELGHFLPSL